MTVDKEEKYHTFSHMWNLEQKKQHECKMGNVWERDPVATTRAKGEDDGATMTEIHSML
jgi:hypothetical protein